MIEGKYEGCDNEQLMAAYENIKYNIEELEELDRELSTRKYPNKKLIQNVTKSINEIYSAYYGTDIDCELTQERNFNAYLQKILDQKMIELNKLKEEFQELKQVNKICQNKITNAEKESDDLSRKMLEKLNH